MKKLLLATSMAAGLAVCAVPAFAQSATTSQPGWAAPANNGAAGSVQAQNFNQAQGAISNGAISNGAGADPGTFGSGAHVGSGSGPNYIMHQQQLLGMPGYSITGNG